MREPSLGPVFGVKGGAAGGGYAQVVPMDDINLHFTGDFHAISTAHTLLSALLDNHLTQGNSLNIDPRRITWPRTIDMNDRALRNAVIGLGGVGERRRARRALGDHPGERGDGDRRARVEPRGSRGAPRAHRRRRDARAASGSPVRASDLKAAGAMSLLLKDAIRPNLVQTLEGGPAIVHAGPFGNIAHGCNSIIATQDRRSRSPTSCVTEAGFGSDLGAEKFFDIKCRSARAASRRRRCSSRRCARSRCTAARTRRISPPRISARSRRDCRISRSTSRTSRSSACR